MKAKKKSERKALCMRNRALRTVRSNVKATSRPPRGTVRYRNARISHSGAFLSISCSFLHFPLAFLAVSGSKLLRSSTLLGSLLVYVRSGVSRRSGQGGYVTLFARFTGGMWSILSWGRFRTYPKTEQSRCRGKATVWLCSGQAAAGMAIRKQ